MKTIVHTHAKYATGTTNLVISQYPNGRLALCLQTPEGMPAATVTINMPDLYVPANHVWIKNYSENQGLMQDLIANSVLLAPIQTAPTGGHEYAQLCPLHPEFIPMLNRQHDPDQVHRDNIDSLQSTFDVALEVAQTALEALAAYHTDNKVPSGYSRTPRDIQLYRDVAILLRHIQNGMGENGCTAHEDAQMTHAMACLGLTWR